MKRSHRMMELRRAFRQGAMAAKEGIDRVQCPYSSPDLASAWVHGWKASRTQEIARMKRHFNTSETDFTNEHYDSD